MYDSWDGQRVRLGPKKGSRRQNQFETLPGNVIHIYCMYILHGPYKVSPPRHHLFGRNWGWKKKNIYGSIMVQIWSNDLDPSLTHANSLFRLLGSQSLLLAQNSRVDCGLSWVPISTPCLLESLILQSLGAWNSNDPSPSSRKRLPRLAPSHVWWHRGINPPHAPILLTTYLITELPGRTFLWLGFAWDAWGTTKKNIPDGDWW